MSFSKRSIISLDQDWGIPHPYNVAVFILVSFALLYLFQKIFVMMFGRKSYKSRSANYTFNFPDVSELGVISNNIKKL